MQNFKNIILIHCCRFAQNDLHLFGPRNLSCLWNAMIVPFLNVTIYGAIWYQGEENAQRPMYPYNCTFPAMIDDWRSKWYASTQHNTDETFPFGFVQVCSPLNFVSFFFGLCELKILTRFFIFSGTFGKGG